MSVYGSRPGTSVGFPVARQTGQATANRASPYPIARPGQRPGQQPGINHRTINRQKWNSMYGGFAYLEAGPTNRLVLSIRSGNPVDVDFALERLARISGFDPDLLRFTELPGLLVGLIDLVQAFLDTRQRLRIQGQLVLDALWQGNETQLAHRRALEAALVLRNLALEEANHKTLMASVKVLKLILAGLEEGLQEGSEDLGELQVYLLEILEVLAPHTPLAPPQGASGLAYDKYAATTRLFPTLVALARSKDRALVINAFRCLTALSLNGSSDTVLALVTYESGSEPRAYPHPIQTAIELLPLADAELGTVVLDYIYQHTLLPANAVLFAARPDLLQILRLVCLKLHFGARRETLSIQLPMKDGAADMWYKTQLQRHKCRPYVYQQSPTDLTPRLTPQEVADISTMKEQARTAKWMQTVFEHEATAEITQVALWQAYRAEFDPIVQRGGQPMLTAPEIIKLSSQVFPGALAMVIEQPERKFIIRGIRVKDRTDMRVVFICRWKDCPKPLGPNDAASLYWHIHQTHCCAQDPPPTQCCWASCNYKPEPSTDPTFTTAALSLHARTHMPTYHPPIGYGTPREQVRAAALPDFPARTTHDRYHAQLDEHNELTGLGFLACLVLRNVARTVKMALEGGASVDALTEGQESIFEALADATDRDAFAVATAAATAAAAVEGDSTPTGAATGREEDAAVAPTMPVRARELDKVDYRGARRGADALLGLERKLMITTMEDHGLGKILGEVLSIVTECGKWAAEKASERTSLLDASMDEEGA